MLQRESINRLKSDISENEKELTDLKKKLSNSKPLLRMLSLSGSPVFKESIREAEALLKKQQQLTARLARVESGEILLSPNKLVPERGCTPENMDMEATFQESSFIGKLALQGIFRPIDNRKPEKIETCEIDIMEQDDDMHFSMDDV